MLQASAEEIEEGLKVMRNPLEYPILMDINHDRSKEGLSPIVKLTVPVLRTHLRGKSINGTEWKMGSKKREDLIEDYRSSASSPDLYIVYLVHGVSSSKSVSLCRLPWQKNP